jgi:transcriptional regulator with XRE-family HTH domain
MESIVSTGIEKKKWRPGVSIVIIDAMSLAKRIKEARLAAGMTQQQLADKCGISMQAVSAWEHGRSKTITGPHLFCLADSLGVDARWLAIGEGAHLKPDTFYSGLTRTLETLPADKQELVLRLIETLKP